METDDAIYVERAQGGDSEAFRVLVERYSQRLFRVAWRILGEEASAEDAVQETFLRAYRALPRFDARSQFGTWLHRIAANTAIDEARGRFDPNVSLNNSFAEDQTATGVFMPNPRARAEDYCDGFGLCKVEFAVEEGTLREKLFGAGSTEANAVAQAWKDVGVFSFFNHRQPLRPPVIRQRLDQPAIRHWVIPPRFLPRSAPTRRRIRRTYTGGAPMRRFALIALFPLLVPACKEQEELTAAERERSSLSARLSRLAVRTRPTWGLPVGDGQKRTRTEEPDALATLDNLVGESADAFDGDGDLVADLFPGDEQVRRAVGIDLQPFVGLRVFEIGRNVAHEREKLALL